MATSRKISDDQQIIDALVSAISPLIGEAAAQVSNIRRMVDEASHPCIASALAAEADRLGLLADAGARALAQATRGDVQFAIPIKLSSIPLRVIEAHDGN